MKANDTPEMWLGRLHSVAHSQLEQLKELNHTLSHHHGNRTTIINIIIGGQMPLDLSKLIAEVAADTTIQDELDTVIDAVVAAYSNATNQADIDAITAQLSSTVNRQKLKTAALKNLVTSPTTGGFALSPLVETAQVGVAYLGQIAAAGGTAPYSNFQLTAGSLPSGLTLDAETGGISGTPDMVESRGFDVSANDAGGRNADSTGNLITVN